MGRDRRDQQEQTPSPVASFQWPLLAAASVTAATASLLAGFAKSLEKPGESGALPAPGWASPNTIRLELASMRLRDFSMQSAGTPALLCAPYALHGATIADFAHGHSIVETLRGAGCERVYVTDWRSATPEMRYFSIDSYLADLNVAVDEVKAPIDLIGLCQGGWLALLYAARFPEKVRRLVVVAAPIDTKAGASALSRFASDTPIGGFESMVQLGDGRVLGNHVMESWGTLLASCDTGKILQMPSSMKPAEYSGIDQRFKAWNNWTVDLPGTYYLQVIRWLYKENRIAEGRFIALGRRVNLADIVAPMYLLAGRDDELVAPQQLFSAARLVGTPKTLIEMTEEPCGHLSLFLGRRTLAGAWLRIARWLLSESCRADES